MKVPPAERKGRVGTAKTQGMGVERLLKTAMSNIQC